MTTLFQSCTEKNENIISEQISSNRTLIDPPPISPCSENYQKDFSDCDAIAESRSITLDDYPGCTFTIILHYYVCPGPLPGPDETVWMLNYELLSHDCQAYNDDVDDAIINGVLEEFSINFESELLLAAYLDIVQQFPNVFGDGPQITVHTATPTCANYCYILNSTKDGLDFYTFEKFPCGVGCCLIQNLYKYVNNEWVFDSANSAQLIEDCDTSDYIGSCPLGTVYSTDCTFTCDMFNKP